MTRTRGGDRDASSVVSAEGAPTTIHCALDAQRCAAVGRATTLSTTTLSPRDTVRPRGSRTDDAAHRPSEHRRYGRGDGHEEIEHRGTLDGARKVVSDFSGFGVLATGRRLAQAPAAGLQASRDDNTAALWRNPAVGRERRPLPPSVVGNFSKCQVMAADTYGNSPHAIWYCGHRLTTSPPPAAAASSQDA